MALHRYLRWRLPGLRPGRATSAACSTCSCAACAGPDTPASTACRAASSAGRRRPRWSSSCPTCSTGPLTVIAGRLRASTAAMPGAPRARTGLLGAFNQAGVLDAADVHVAPGSARLGGERDETVLLAAALAVRAVRAGLGLRRPRHRADRTVLGEATSRSTSPRCRGRSRPAGWRRCRAQPARRRRRRRPRRRCRCGSSTACSTWTATGGRSSWSAATLDRPRRRPRRPRSTWPAAAGAGPRCSPDAGRGPSSGSPRAVARRATGSRCSPAGPGTGKTTTVARLLALLPTSPARRLRIALAAPTGKAAARLQEAVRDARRRAAAADRAAAGATTLHRLLGWRPGSRSRFRHDRATGCRYDVVVVDETSMVSLTMMARLLDAVRPHARLVLVGDPDQLASVEAGAVLGDLVPAPTGAAEPARGRRADASSACPAAAAQRRGDARPRAGGSAVRSPSSRGPCRPATPTPRSPCCEGGQHDLEFAEPGERGRGSAGTSSPPAGRWPRPPRRRRGGGARRAEPSTGCCARTGADPFGVARWTARDRALARRTRRRADGAGTRAAAAGHRQRLRHRAVQRRHRRRRAAAGRAAGRVRPRRPADAVPAVAAVRRGRPCTR